MIKKVSLFILTAAIALTAATYQSEPTNPVAGEKVTWNFTELDRTSDSPVMLIAVHTSDSIIPEVIEGSETGNGWSFTHKLPADARFVQFKVEDDAGPLADDDGLFFGQPVYDPQGDPRFDACRLHANLYLNSPLPRIPPAMESLQQELAHHPLNWSALAQLRGLQVAMGETDETDVVAELDSLLAAEPDSAQILHFAAMSFFISSENYQLKGEGLMKLCVEDYPSSPYWTWEQYTIYEAISQSPQRIGDFEREVFPLLEGEARETGYFMLMLYALANPRVDRLTYLTEGLTGEFPDSRLASAFIINTMEVKHNVVGSRWAEEMLTWHAAYPDDPEINIKLAQYYRDRSWKTALDYYLTAVKGSESPEPAILFAEAAAVKAKNLDEAKRSLSDAAGRIDADYFRTEFWWQDFDQRHENLIKNRAQLYATLGLVSYRMEDYDAAVEELLISDSLLVEMTGYEEVVYLRLLEAGERAGDLEARKIALLNLLVLDPENIEKRLMLEDIYRLENDGSTEGYAEWLTREVQEASLRLRLHIPLPDFQFLDTEGDVVFLSQFTGKVVVINYWATWCGPCKEEIPQLNELVTEFKDNKDVVFLGITNEPPPTVMAYLEQLEFNYDIHFDAFGVAQAMQIEAIPTHFIIDQNGRLQYQHIGAAPNIRDILRLEINALLSE